MWSYYEKRIMKHEWANEEKKKFAVRHFYCATRTKVASNLTFCVSYIYKKKITFEPSTKGWQMFLTKLEWASIYQQNNQKATKIDGLCHTCQVHV